MAIYKPSNCTPFLTAKDLTEGFDISCELNTSNEVITGYKIRILDSKNNLVYEGDEYSKINIPAKGSAKGEAADGVGNGYSNTGLNGSMLILPLIVNLDSAPTVTTDKTDTDIRKNIIYHYTEEGKDKFVYLGKNAEGKDAAIDINTTDNPYLFTNQSANQPFKWEITLAQGELTNGAPSDNKYYDMTVSTGKILGSCGERIQSYLSEYIYKDYYLQLYSDIDAGTQLGQRVRISSYDHSYGYIYPQEGTLDDGTVQNAKSFQVFKDTNDPQYVSATRKVDYISDADPLKVTDQAGGGAEGVMDKNTNTLSITYKSLVVGSLSEVINRSAYIEGVANEPFTSNDTVLFVGYGNDTAGGGSNFPNTTSSPYNGVYQFVSYSTTEERTEDKQKVFDCTVNWQRPSAFSNYATYIGRAINVANGTYGARNYSCDAQADIGGKINETALTFYDETPVGLYPAYDKDGNVITLTTPVKSFKATGKTYSEVISVTGIVNNVTSTYFVDENGEQINSTKEQIIATPAGGNHIKISCSDLSGSVYEYKVEYNSLESIAPVLKTGYNVDGTVNTQIVYLNPSINVENDMKLFSGNNLLNDYTISKFDNEPKLDNKFSPTYSAVLTANGTDTYPKLNDDYEIRSFFKISDENPFYAYDTPMITIDVKPKNENYDSNVKSVNFETLNNKLKAMNGKDIGYSYIIFEYKDGYGGYWYTAYDNNNQEINTVQQYPTLNSLGVVLYDNTVAKFTIINDFNYSQFSFKTDFVATNRYINVSATYTQDQNKSWKSFYWTLEDENGYIRATDKTYVGEIATTFLGLESGKSYNLTLYLEDEMGNFYTISKTVYCGANTVNTKVYFQAQLNCQDYATDIYIGANIIISEPTQQNAVDLDYTSGSMQISIKKDGKTDSKSPLVSYEKINLGPSQADISNIFTADKPAKLVSEHTGLASNFEGGIIEYQIGDENKKVGAYLESLVVNSGVEINGKKLTEVNSNRNNIYFRDDVKPNSVSWQSDIVEKGVLSTWIPAESGVQDPQKEYIDSDISSRNEKWVNIKDELNNQNSSGAIIMPFNATSKSDTGKNISIWSDRKIERDSYGTINVFVLNESKNDYEYNKWNDEDHYWQDAPANSGEIKKYKNGSVQTNLRNQTFKFEFNKAVGDENYKVTVTKEVKENG